MPRLEMFETDPVPGQREIRIAGELDAAAVDRLQAAIDRAADCELVLIDLRSCDLIDSIVLMALIRAYSRRQGHGVRLALVGANRHVRWTLEAAGLAARGAVFETAADAVRGQSE